MFTIPVIVLLHIARAHEYHATKHHNWLNKIHTGVLELHNGLVYTQSFFNPRTFSGIITKFDVSLLHHLTIHAA